MVPVSRVGKGWWLAVVGSLLAAQPVWACAVCFSSIGGRVLRSFYLTTALLMSLPFLIVGSIATWLVLRARRAVRGGPPGDAGP